MSTSSHGSSCFCTHRIMDPISLYALAEVGMELYTLYKIVSFGATTVDWAQANLKLQELAAQMSRLENSRPDNPEWAKADGTFDKRRRPYPAMKKALQDATTACIRKDKKMLEEAFEQLTPGEFAADDDILELQHPLQLCE